MKEKEKWTNIIRYRAEDYLAMEEFLALKGEIEGAWRSLGWINLRMANDININTKTAIPRPEMRRRLAEIKEKIEKCMELYLKEDE